jgi:hypothetical protein
MDLYQAHCWLRPCIASELTGLIDATYGELWAFSRWREDLIMNCETITGLPGPGDKLSVSDPEAVRLWAKVLCIEPEELRVAVEIVGSNFDDLVDFMREKAW